MALEADALHLKTDIYTSFGTYFVVLNDSTDNAPLARAMGLTIFNTTYIVWV